MEEAQPMDQDVGLSHEEAAKMLGVDTGKIKRLGAQGRLQAAQTGDEGRYDLGSVCRMEAENLIREMLAQSKERIPELTEQIEYLAELQYMRGKLDMSAEIKNLLEQFDLLDKEIKEHFGLLEKEIAEAFEEIKSQVSELGKARESELKRFEEILERLYQKTA